MAQPSVFRCISASPAAGQLAEVPFRARKRAQSAYPQVYFSIGRLQFDEPQADFGVILAGLAHRPHAVGLAPPPLE
jgi:hypothetical protein